MTFIFTSNFSAPFYSCLNRTEASHIFYKHMDTGDIWIISGSSRNNLTYSFLLEEPAFLSSLLLRSLTKHPLCPFSSSSIRGIFLIQLSIFLSAFTSLDFVQVQTEKRPLDSESRDLSSPTNVSRGQGQAIHHYRASVSHRWLEWLNSQGPSGSDILFLNITLFYSQATENSGAAHKLSTILINSKA